MDDISYQRHIIDNIFLKIDRWIEIFYINYICKILY